jgi:hypothetical protein
MIEYRIARGGWEVDGGEGVQMLRYIDVEICAQTVVTIVPRSALSPQQPVYQCIGSDAINNW